MTKLPSIFISIASYRDTECQHTVIDAFKQALHPERIFVGICWQYDAVKDEDCFIAPAPYPDQVRIIPYESHEAKGACWARSQALSLHEGEDYILMIDAHMRFVKGWDALMIDALEHTPTKPAVLSGMPPNYTPPDHLHDHEKHGFPMIAVGMISHPNQLQPIHLVSYMRPKGSQGWGLQISPFVVGNFMFMRAETQQQIPFDPHIFFWGEEIAYSMRLWTHGIDIYQPDKPLIYHHWFAKSRNEGEKSVYKTEKTKRTELSHLRLRHLLFDEAAPEEALVEFDRYGLGSVRSREDFWRFADVDMTQRIIGERAKAGRWLQFPKLEKTHLPSIFVSIASYRDPECQHTVRDLYAKATHPERITVGICWQFEPEKDRDCFQYPPPYPDQIRRVTYHYSESKGGCWARAQALSLRDGEDYVLQIDAHMRFAEGWDETMIAMLKRSGSPKAALTSTVPNYNPPDDLEETAGLVHGTYVGQIGYPHDLQPVHLCGWIRTKQELLTHQLPVTPFFVGNFFFAPARVFDEIPFDPYIYFRGQELVYSARLWTHGWDLFHPDEAVIYHAWHAKTRKAKDAEDYKAASDAAEIGKKRVWHLLKLQQTDDPKALKEINRFDMGKARSLESFWEFAGIDLNLRTISDKSQKGQWN